MITELKLERLKSFQEVTRVDCRPLTILTGTNSSGKSTIIQSLLLQKQLTDPSRSSTGSNSIVRLNGEFVSPGSFEDLSWAHKSEPVHIGVSFDDSHKRLELELELELGGKQPDDARLETVHFALERRRSAGQATDRLRWSTALEASDALAEELVALLGGPASREEQPAPRHERAYSTEHPYTLEVHAGEEVVGGGICSLRGLYPDMMDESGRPVSASRWFTARCEQADLDPEQLESLFSSRRLGDLFARVHYLGPLRDDPRSLYTGLRGTSATDIGVRGAGAASALADYGEQRIQSPRLERGGVPVDESLINAVCWWAQYIGVAMDMVVKREKHGAELRVRTLDAKAATARGPSTTDVITNVGIGVSQVLPVLVLGLAAEPGSTLVFEQPELHLHPSVQSRLADFLAACVLSGRQMIIETHSEHLLNRVRLLVARNQLRCEDVSLNFIERDRFGSRLERIALRADGSLERWPKGFFDETQRALDDLLKERLR